MRKKIKPAACIIVVTVAMLLLFGWKIPAVIQIESLDLPGNCETIYPVRVHISDVYWLHIKGEKVIKCPSGYEAAKEDIESNNKPSALRNIQIQPYGGMSDIAVYDAEFDEGFRQAPDQDCYIRISYLRKI